MIIYAYYDPASPSGMFAFPSKRKARAARAASFTKDNRPEMFRVEIGKVDKAKVCALLSHQNYAEEIIDIA